MKKLTANIGGNKLPPNIGGNSLPLLEVTGYQVASGVDVLINAKFAA